MSSSFTPLPAPTPAAASAPSGVASNASAIKAEGTAVPPASTSIATPSVASRPATSGVKRTASGASLNAGSSAAGGASNGSGTTAKKPRESKAGKEREPRRRKVGTACIYCRRSHMTCDEGRPCQRCIKRDIGHLCHDKQTTSAASASSTARPRQSSSTARATREGSSSSAGLANAAAASMAAMSASPQQSAAPTTTAVPAAAATSSAMPRFPYGATAGSPTAPDASLPGGTSSIGAPLPTSTPYSAASPLAPGNLSLSMQQPVSGPAQLSGNGSGWGWGGASVLGGAGFLGLGGGAAEEGGFSATGDAAGGMEFSLLSEFLETLDGPAVATPGGSNQTWGAAGAGPTPRIFGTAPLPPETTPIARDDEAWDNTAAAGPSNAGADVQMQLAQQGIQGSQGAQTLAPSMQAQSSQTGAPPASPSVRGRARARTRGGSTASSAGGAGRFTLTAGSAGGSAMLPSPSSSGPSSAALAGFSSKTERFFLTAADQNDGTRDERLGKVIQAKYDAGLLRPYNHVNGYSRLNRWMEQNVSPASRRRILKPLSVFRPAFRAVAQSLTNIDLIYIEEAFERLLLDYDRVFSTQGIPACLWRRTGEIYKGNREFAELVGVGIEALREGRLCIYELMEEESAVNYWEKYGAVAFDPGQKAVLTSCVLKVRSKPASNLHGGASSASVVAAQLPLPYSSNVATGTSTPALDGKSNGGGAGPSGSSASVSAAEEKAVTLRASPAAADDGFRRIPCCFSFTIRRDSWGLPCLLAGNWLVTDPDQR